VQKLGNLTFKKRSFVKSKQFIRLDFNETSEKRPTYLIIATVRTNM